MNILGYHSVLDSRGVPPPVQVQESSSPVSGPVSKHGPVLSRPNPLGLHLGYAGTFVLIV